jgi:hypothetical protein
MPLPTQRHGVKTHHRHADEPETVSDDSNGLQEFHKVPHLVVRQAQSQERIVVLHDVPKRGGTTVVEIRGMLPECPKRRRAVSFRRSSIRICRIHPGLRRIVQNAEVHVGIERRDMAGRAPTSTVEHRLAPRRCLLIETIGRRRGLQQAELIIAQRRQSRLHQIGCLYDVDPLSVSNSSSSCDREPDQISAVGDPPHMVQIGSDDRRSTAEGQRRVTLQ